MSAYGWRVFQKVHMAIEYHLAEVCFMKNSPTHMTRNTSDLQCQSLCSFVPQAQVNSDADMVRYSEACGDGMSLIVPTLDDGHGVCVSVCVCALLWVRCVRVCMCVCERVWSCNREGAMRRYVCTEGECYLILFDIQCTLRTMSSWVVTWVTRFPSIVCA